MQSTLSKSIKCKFPTPRRAKIIATFEPSPPSPQIATRANFSAFAMFGELRDESINSNSFCGGIEFLGAKITFEFGEISTFSSSMA